MREKWAQVTFKKNRTGKKSTFAHAEDNEMQLANDGSLGLAGVLPPPLAMAARGHRTRMNRST